MTHHPVIQPVSIMSRERKFAILGPCAPGSTQDTAVLQRFLAQFPKQIIREKISKNREFLGDIWEFGPQKVTVHFSHTCPFKGRTRSVLADEFLT
jgi:hypothetical protein